MKLLHLSLMILCTTGVPLSQEEESGPLVVVPFVDIARYVGTWYELARLPNSFQEKCTGDVTATYSILDNGDLKVVNRCRQKDGEITEAEGIARRASNDEPNTKLEVRFAPPILSFIPFVWGDYWIIDLAPDYSYAVVGEPDRRYLWILARSQNIDDDLFNTLLEKAKNQGYDITLLAKTVHSR